jgi:hypothetical protein
MNLTLTEEEAHLLRNTLEECFRDLRLEIRHTHESDLKEELHHRERVLSGILARLEVPVPAAV